MASEKKKGLPKKKKEAKVGLFDFLNDITFEKTNILNRENEHAYSQFMICRFLSMNDNYLPIAARILNQYQGSLTNQQFHQLCIALIPKRKVFLKYNIGTPLKKECKAQVKWISDYFKVSENDAYDYYTIGGEELVTNIKRLHGIVE